MSVKVIMQRISAGNDFDGTPPTGAGVPSKDKIRFPEEAAGGLFDFELADPGLIRGIEIIFGGQTTWSLSKRDSDGNDVVLFSGTTETTYFNDPKIWIYEEEKLKLVTSGASTAMRATIAVDPNPG